MRKFSMLVVALTAAALVAATPAQAATATRDAGGPTIVLVHGAWETASSFSPVAERLRTRGFRVIAPELPLRTLAGDASVVANIAKGVKGPVVLVGHSYGGAVISNVDLPNVKALVFIAAFAPDRGESILQLDTRALGSLVAAALVPVPFAAPDGSLGTDLYINPLLYRSVLAQDVAEPTATEIAGSQRPLTLAALTEGSGAPGWKTHRSWYMVARDDRAIPAATERFMAARANATTVEIASSHAAHVSHPNAVADLVVSAADGSYTSSPPVAAVTSLHLRPATFRAVGSGPAVRVAGGSSPTRVGYALNVAATVRFTVRRAVNRRFVAVRGSFTRRRPAGSDRFTFTGRLGGRSLAPGRYRLVATPHAGKATSTTFRIVR